MPSQNVTLRFKLFKIKDSIGFVPLRVNQANPARHNEGSRFANGALPIDEFKELLRLEKLNGERRANFQTVAGFVLYRLGRIPNAAESFEWSNLRLEIVNTDDRRIDKVLIEPVSEQIRLFAKKTNADFQKIRVRVRFRECAVKLFEQGVRFKSFLVNHARIPQSEKDDRSRQSSQRNREIMLRRRARNAQQKSDLPAGDAGRR